MDQDKISKFIVDIRKKNKLTQKEFADKFDVTYNIVTKWEKGKEVPNLEMIKKICKEFSVDINDVLDIKESINETDMKKHFLVLTIFLILLVVVFFVQLEYSKKNSYEDTDVSISCDNYNIFGSMSYDDTMGTIYISDIEYCGLSDNSEYENMSCSLYEMDSGKFIKLSDCAFETNKAIKLEEYLKNVDFTVDDFEYLCNENLNKILQLKIEATDSEDRITEYKIPIKLNNCKK